MPIVDQREMRSDGLALYRSADIGAHDWATGTRRFAGISNPERSTECLDVGVDTGVGTGDTTVGTATGVTGAVTVMVAAEAGLTGN